MQEYFIMSSLVLTSALLFLGVVEWLSGSVLKNALYPFVRARAVDLTGRVHLYENGHDIPAEFVYVPSVTGMSDGTLVKFDKKHFYRISLEDIGAAARKLNKLTKDGDIWGRFYLIDPLLSYLKKQYIERSVEVADLVLKSEDGETTVVSATGLYGELFPIGSVIGGK